MSEIVIRTASARHKEIAQRARDLGVRTAYGGARGVLRADGAAERAVLWSGARLELAMGELGPRR